MPRKTLLIVAVAILLILWAVMRSFGTSQLRYEVDATLEKAKYTFVEVDDSSLALACGLTSMYGVRFIGIRPPDEVGGGDIVSGYVCCSFYQCEILP